MNKYIVPELVPIFEARKYQRRIQVIEINEITSDYYDEIMSRIDDDIRQATSIQQLGTLLNNIIRQYLGDIYTTILFSNPFSEFIPDTPVYRSPEFDVNNSKFIDASSEQTNKLTRIKISNSPVLTQIFHDNQSFYVEQVDAVEQNLPVIKRLIELDVSTALFVPLCHEDTVFGYVLNWQLNNHGRFTLDKMHRKLIQNTVSKITPFLRLNHLSRLNDLNAYRFDIFKEKSKDILIAFKQDGFIIDANDQVSKLLGYSCEELLATNIEDLVVTEDLKFPINTVMDELQYIRFIGDAGQIVLFEISMWLLPEFGDKKIIYWMGRDQREREKVLDNMIQTEKNRSLEILSGGIAHDFNNYLSVIKGNTSILQRYLEDTSDSEVIAIIENINEIVDKAHYLTNQLLTYSTGGTLDLTAIRLDHLIEATLEFTLSGTDIISKIDKQDSANYIIKGDDGMLTQVFTNLILNARDALKHEQEKIITTRIRESDDYYVISIRDNGEGIPPQLINRIFDPFFSSKDSGTGLGLSTVGSVIREHGGEISVESELDQYTEFEIKLPKFQGNISELSNSSTSPLSTGNRIWVMDDLPEIRDVLSKQLRQLDQEVNSFAEGTQLLNSLSEEDVIPDLLVLDITNRIGMGGLKVVEELLNQNIDIPIILISGYAKDFDSNNLLKHTHIEFIPKPITQDNLIQILSKLLD